MDRSPAGSPRSSPRSLVLPVASLYSRLLFTKGLCLCYFIAFASALAQWEGLHGLNGIYPVAPFGPAADDQAYTVLVLGLLVASAGLASASAPIVPLLAALPLLYVMLLDLAGATPSPFFHFQWDVLLVEAGLVGAFWGDLFEDERIEPSRAVRWALRFLAFKLMWMSGVVKITHGDKTWLGLTALDYHFASQPLPTPLAAYANAVPSAFKRWATGASLAIEIPGSLLLLAPDRYSRMLAAARLESMHVALMVGIAATGNYNFFNLLTAVLMLPVWEERPWRFTRRAAAIELACGALCIGGFVAMTVAMLRVDASGAKPLLDALVLVATPASMRAWCTVVVPSAMAWTLAMLAVAGVNDAVDGMRRGNAFVVLMRSLLLFAATVSILASGVPLASLNADKLRPPEWASRLHAPLRRFSSGYGLFRSMTGVGARGEVAVPVLLFEAQHPNGTWSPLEFRYYVSSEASPLRWVAPHQPRLDWQLWFGALVPDVRYTEWVPELADRLLHGSPAVWALLRDTGPLPIDALRARVRDMRLAAPGSAAPWEFVSSGFRVFLKERRRPAHKLGPRCAGPVCSHVLAWVDWHWASIPAASLATCLALSALVRRRRRQRKQQR